MKFIQQVSYAAKQGEHALATFLLENCDAIWERQEIREQAAPAIPEPVDMAVFSGCHTQAQTRRRRANGYRTVTKEGKERAYASEMNTLNPACEHCGARNMLDDKTAGDLVCTACGTCYANNITDDAYMCLPWKEFIEARSTANGASRKGCYKRSIYFNSVLIRALGRQIAKAPPHVWKVAEQALSSHRLQHPGMRFTGAHIRAAMKQHKMSKWYGQCSAMAIQLAGREGVEDLDHGTETRIKRMFSRMQHSVDRHCVDRKNILNYQYVLYQLLVIVGRKDLTDSLEMLKCDTRMRKHDAAWKAVCADMSWPFEPVRKPRGTR